MSKKRTGRKSLRDVLLENDKANSMLAALAGKPKVENSMIKIPNAPKPRGKSTQPRKHPLEKEVQKDILKLLRYHPKVHWFVRINSGSFVVGDRYIRSNTQDGMSDILGMLKGGRLFVIEVKSMTGVLKQNQKVFLQIIADGGGLSFVARSVDDVIKHL